MNPTSERRSTRLSTALKLGAALGATALWVRHRAHQAEERFPPAGRFIEIDGVRLHYQEWGSGSPVLLLHGNGAMASDFAGCGLAQMLARQHRVIAFDRPGFGYSERPRPGLWSAERQAALLAHACTALDVSEPVVVGHSWGTHVALALALDATASVRGLVLVAGYYFPTVRADTVLAAPRLPLVGDVMRYTVTPLAARLMLPRVLKRSFSPHPVAPEFLEAVPAPLMLRPWQLKAVAEEAGLLPVSAAKLAPRYGELQMPVEIFAGTEDGIVEQDDQSPRLHEAIAHSTLHLLPGEGHMLHYRATEAIAQAVERIAQGTSSAAQSDAGGYPLRKQAGA